MLVIMLTVSLGDKVTAYPWYLSDSMLMALSLFITGCAVYSLVGRKGRGGDDDDTTSGSGLSAPRGIVDPLTSLREETKEMERRLKDYWDSYSFHFNTISFLYHRFAEKATCLSLKTRRCAEVKGLTDKEPFSRLCFLWFLLFYGCTG